MNELMFTEAQKFAKGFTVDKPPLTDFQVEQIWLNGASFAAHKLYAQEIADLTAKLERATEESEKVFQTQGHIYFNSQHTGRRLFFTEVGWELEPHSYDKKPYYFETVMEAVKTVDVQGEPLEEIA